MLVRANGEPTYFAADAAYYLSKKDRGFDEKIYLLGADHHGYINRLKAIAACAGDDPERNIEVRIGQLVNLGGAKLSKRAGNIIELRDLIGWIGTDAVRYSLARYPADSPLSLDGEELRRQTNDNPVFYVQYAHARTANVARLAAEDGVRREDGFDPALLSDPTEAALLADLGDFPRVVAQAADLREPHRVARYLEELAGRFHKWYDTCRVRPMTADEEVTDLHRSRLWLNDATRQVLANGLDLLGVSRARADVSEPDRCAHTRPAPSTPRATAARPALPARAPDVKELLPQLWPGTVAAGTPTGRSPSAGSTSVDLARRARDGRVRPRRGRTSAAGARAFRDGFAEAFEPVCGGADVYYAGKAFLCTAVARWVAEEGLRLDVCTGGELAVARARRVPGGADRLPRQQQDRRRDPRRPSSTASGGSSLDSFEEIERVAAVADRARTSSRPSWSGSPSASRRTPTSSSPPPTRTRSSASARRRATRPRPCAGSSRTATSCDLLGLHSHIGSQIFDTAGFEVAARRLVGLHAEVAREHGVAPARARPRRRVRHRLHLRAHPARPRGCSPRRWPTSSRASAGPSVTAASPGCRGSPSSPGARSPGPSTFTLYEVGTVKDVDLDDGHRAHVRRGRRRHERQHPHRALRRRLLLHARRAGAPRAEPALVRVVGRHCESGDIVVLDEYLPADVRPGDLIAVPGTGAYCRQPVEPVQPHPQAPGRRGARTASPRVIVRRETIEDLLALDVGSDRGRPGHPERARRIATPAWRTNPVAPLRVALLGCGVVGSAVARMLVDARRRPRRPGRVPARARRHRRPPARQRDRSDVPVDPALFTTDAEDLVTRADIVIEVIGGIDPARGLILRAMEHGASVVTANKALLAEDGPTLYAAAAEHGVDLYYEAAVAGAIPILRPIRESLAGDHVRRVLGIVNGTTNFVLDKMDSTGAGFAETVEQAQALGYAEADPTADVEGFDAAAKAAILASLAFHTRVAAAHVHREGITEVTAADIRAAREMDAVVKLLAICERVDDATAPRRSRCASTRR